MVKVSLLLCLLCATPVAVISRATCTAGAAGCVSEDDDMGLAQMNMKYEEEATDHSGSHKHLHRSGPPFEPPLPGVMPGIDRPHIVLAQDVDWPPYAYYVEGTSGTTGGLAGFGYDVAMGMGEVCNMDIEVVQTKWSHCWDGSVVNSGDNGAVGQGLINGHYHGCMTYTHAQGVRNRFLEFTESLVKPNKPAGLLVLLNPDGTPRVNGNSDLSGLRVVDVAGWAPTADGIMYVENKCTGQKYAKKDKFTLLSATGTADHSPNDHAMMMLRSYEADAIFLYADQPYNYQCDDDGKSKTGAEVTWKCHLWRGFGTQYAFVQTGQFGHAINGTTIAISKKGSGLKKILDPCLREFMKTEKYYQACAKAGFEKTCIENEFFPEADSNAATKPWMKPTAEQSEGCADGYCSCP